MATKKTTAAGKAIKAKAISSTPVRNTAMPKTAPPPLRPSPFDMPATTRSSNGNSSTPAQRQVTHEQIARRAYEISQSPEGRTPDENWFRAERELRNGR